MLSNPDQQAPTNIQALLHAKIMAAWKLRQALDLPNQDTDVYRLINRCGGRRESESVGGFWPVLDKVGATACFGVLWNDDSNENPSGPCP